MKTSAIRIVALIRRCLLPFIVLVPLISNSQSHSLDEPTEPIKFSMLFHKLGTNSLRSLSYSCGSHYVIAGLGTYYMVHSGADWEWSNVALRHRAITYSGMPFGALGFVLPVALPVGLYFRGKHLGNSDYQITGLALGQAAMLGLSTSSVIKVFTGRKHPGILDPLFGQHRDTKDFSNDFAFGFMERGVFDGWPSSHTSVITAMAITLIELYPHNTTVKVISYSYAALTAVAMSVTVHWASDVLAGALIGYSIGKSVGRSYRNMMNSQSNANPGKTSGLVLVKNMSFNLLPGGFTINYSIQ